MAEQNGKSPRELAYDRVSDSLKGYRDACFSEGRVSGREQGLADAAKNTPPALTGIALADVQRTGKGLVGMVALFEGHADYTAELSTTAAAIKLLAAVEAALTSAPKAPPVQDAPKGPPPRANGASADNVVRSHEDATSRVKGTDAPNTSDGAEAAYQAEVDRWLNGDGTKEKPGFQVSQRKAFLRSVLDSTRSGQDTPDWADFAGTNVWDEARRDNAVKHAEKIVAKHFG